MPRRSSRPSTASHTLVLPVRRGPAITTLAPLPSSTATSCTSAARPIIWLAGIGWSVGKRSALRWRAILSLYAPDLTPAAPSLAYRMAMSSAVDGGPTAVRDERPTPKGAADANPDPPVHDCRRLR